eukprot:2461843-Ditylum_brightwellii.AAC.1
MDYMKREGMFHNLTRRPPWVSSDKHWPPEYIRGMEKVTRRDIEVYIGIVFFMGHTVLPSIDDYWSTDILFGQLSISSYMSRDRFRHIRSVLQLKKGCVHLSAKEKIASWLDDFGERCHDEADHGMRVSIDEQTIGCKSRWTRHTTRNAHKKAGQGFTVYSVNDVDTGYTIAFHINTQDKPIKGVVEKLASKLKFK